MKKKVIIVLLFIILLFPSVANLDGNIESGLKSVLLGEYETGKIIYEYNIDEPVEVASISKLMTYLVAMDEVSKGEVGLDDIVEIGENPAQIGGSSFNLKKGEKLDLKTLLDSILIVSANDSCVAIAEYIAGSEEEFVKMMNDKAKEIGLNSFNFLNSNGLPEKEGQNMMSTRDIFILSRYVISKYPEILNITKNIGMKIDVRSFNEENTNPLLKELSLVDGLKTGYTDKAGYCLVSTLKVTPNLNDERPFRMIGIVMGAESEEIRKDKSLQLLRYGIENYHNKKVLSQNKPVSKIKVNNAKNKDVEVFPNIDFYIFCNKEAIIETEIILNKDISAPINANGEVGKIEVYCDGIKEGEVELIVKRDIERENIFFRILRYIKALITIFE